MEPEKKPIESVDEMYADTHYPPPPKGQPPYDPFSEAASWDPEEHPDGTPDPYPNVELDEEDEDEDE